MRDVVYFDLVYVWLFNAFNNEIVQSKSLCSNQSLYKLRLTSKYKNLGFKSNIKLCKLFFSEHKLSVTLPGDKS